MTTVDAIFVATLGTFSPLNLAFDQAYWLGISVSGDPEATPRTPLTTTPYAFTSRTVEDTAVTAAKLRDNAVTEAKILPNVVSSVDGVVNDAGNIDLIAGSNITITPNDAANTITIAASGTGGDISAVNAGTGLSGGGTTGDVTLNVAVPLNLTGNTEPAVISAENTGAGIGLIGKGSGSWGIWGYSQNNQGVVGQTANAGDAGVLGTNLANGNTGWLAGTNAGAYGHSTDSPGVYGSSVNNVGVYGTSSHATAIWGYSQSSVGVFGKSDYGSAVEALSHNSTALYARTNAAGASAVVASNGENGSQADLAGSYWGVYGVSNGPGGNGVTGRSTEGYGVTGYSSTGTGIYGSSDVTGIGVLGISTGGTAVYGTSTNGIGVRGISTHEDGVSGQSGGAYKSGVFGSNSNASGWAGYFTGNVYVNGNLGKAGGGFKIDHPLNPADKYLQHSFVESPDMKDMYDGIVTLNQSGEATVELPEWFEALNEDYRYQLTAIGAPGPDLYIAQEITGNQFRIAGGQPGMKVSWQVTGIRHDSWAQAHRIQVELDKTAPERGKYLNPLDHGQPETSGLDYERVNRPKPEATPIPTINVNPANR